MFNMRYDTIMRKACIFVKEKIEKKYKYLKNKFLYIFDSFVFDAKKVIKVNNIIVSANSIILIGMAASSPNANIDKGIPKNP